MGEHKEQPILPNSREPNGRLLLFGFLFIIVLHLLGGFWNSYYSWGFSYWSLFPASVTIVLGVVSVLMVLLSYQFRSRLKLGFLDQLNSSRRSKLISIVASLTASVTLFFLLFMFRSQAHFYGDGFSILNFCSSSEPLEIAHQYYLQLGAVYWHQLMFNLLYPVFDKEIIFALTNTLGGVVAFWGAFMITGLLSRNTRERLFYLVILLSSGSIVLFFGYIENYTWATAFMLWGIYFSIAYVQRLYSNWIIVPLILSSFISIAFHLITLPILVVTLLALSCRIESVRVVIDRISMGYWILATVVGSLLVVLVSRLSGDLKFVHLWEISDNSYTLYSLSHVSDVFNLLFLLAPLGLMYVIFASRSIGDSKGAGEDVDETERILFVISLLTFASAFFVDPLLGMVRDWDLFSFYGIPLTLWGGYRFARRYKNGRVPSWVIVASFVVVLVHIVPNVYEKNQPELAVEYLDEIIRDDPHYQSDYLDGYRATSWGYLLRKETGRSDLAKKYFARRLEGDNENAQACYNLGVIFFDRSEYDSARIYLKRGFDLNPGDPAFLSKLAIIENRINNHQLAESYARLALRLDPDHLPALTVLAVVCSRKNNVEEALSYFRRAYELSPDTYEQNINLGILFANGVDIDSAHYYMDQSLLMAPEDQKSVLLGNLISIAVKRGQIEKAVEYLDQLKEVDPNSTAIREREKEIFGK